MTDAAARIRQLEEEVEDLKAEILWLKGEPVSFGLLKLMAPTLSSKSCAHICEVILRRKTVRYEEIANAVWGDNEPAGGTANHIKVYLCKIRKVLGPLGVNIETVWGVGVRTSEDSRARLRELIAAHETQVAA